MGLIQVKNPDLYRAWIEYLMKREKQEQPTPQIRTEAFFRSQRNDRIPLS